MWSGTCLLVLLVWSGLHLGIARHVSQNAGLVTDLDSLGSRISADVERKLAPLDNLGAEITAKVGKSLMPVYAMAIKEDMVNGIGGTTIATYKGRIPRSFIIRNDNRSVCTGIIRGSQCDGSLKPFQIENKEDYCYVSSHAVINDVICLSSGPITIIANNNHIICKSDHNLPTLILPQNEFQSLCCNITSGKISYRYYANPYDPKAIPIPNSNPYVTCRNNQPGVCKFQADKKISSSSIILNQSNFHDSVVSSGGSINIG